MESLATIGYGTVGSVISSTVDRGVPDLGGLMRELDAAAPYELLDVCAVWLQRCVTANDSALLLADYAQVVLEAVPASLPSEVAVSARAHAQSSCGERHHIDDSPAGTAYRDQRIVELESTDDRRAGATSITTVFVPVSIRAERVGVLRVALERASISPALLQTLQDVAQLVAHVITGARRYTDRFEVLRRNQPLKLAAEIQWELLPVLAYDLPAFSIAGALEPTYEIGGDSFDYAVSAHSLSISITDAVGHGLRAALLGSLTVAALRNSRRDGQDIHQQFAIANRHLVEQFPELAFVTGLALRLDTATGSGIAVNAGHPPPLLLRHGRVCELPLSPDYPLGLTADAIYRPQPISLHPGDRLLLITDGITEAHRRGEPPFDLPRLNTQLANHTDLSAAEFVRQLTSSVLDHCNGELIDDATVVCLDWRGDAHSHTEVRQDHDGFVNTHG